MTLADWDFRTSAFSADRVCGTITSLVRREIPEPGTLAPLGLGLLGLGLTRRRAN